MKKILFIISMLLPVVVIANDDIRVVPDSIWVEQFSKFGEPITEEHLYARNACVIEEGELIRVIGSLDDRRDKYKPYLVEYLPEQPKVSFPGECEYKARFEINEEVLLRYQKK